MKFATDRSYSDPKQAARKLVEIANSVEAVQDGRIYIELINAPFLYELKGSPAEYKAGLDRKIFAERVTSIAEVSNKISATLPNIPVSILASKLCRQWGIDE
jgi:hypothetical protein